LEEATSTPLVQSADLQSWPPNTIVKLYLPGGANMHDSAYTVVRATSQSYGDTEISGDQSSKTPESIEEKFGVGDYVGVCVKYNCCVLSSFPFLFRDPKFRSRPETKP